MSRNSLIARIHLAKARTRVCMDCGTALFGARCPECGSEFINPLTEKKYRHLLSMLTGKESCREMDEDGLRKVMDFFDRAGFSRAYPHESPRAAAQHQKYAVIRQIERRGKVILGPGWEKRVAGFCKSSIGKDSLSDLTAIELRKVIGWINRLDKVQQQGSREQGERI